MVTLESLNCGVIPLRVVLMEKLLNDMNDKKIIMPSEIFSKLGVICLDIVFCHENACACALWEMAGNR